MPSNLTDDCLRSDDASSPGTPSDAGTPYVVLAGQVGVSSHQLYTPSGSRAVAVRDFGAADCAIEIIRAVEGSGSWAHIVRASDASNYWIEYFLNGFIGFYKHESGSDTSISTTSGSVSNGAATKSTANGNVLTMFVNASQIIQITNSFNNTATKHGFGTQNNDTAARFGPPIKISVLSTMSLDRDHILTGSSGTTVVTVTGVGIAGNLSISVNPGSWSIASQTMGPTGGTVTLNHDTSTGTLTLSDGSITASMTATGTATTIADGNSNAAATWDTHETPGSAHNATVAATDDLTVNADLTINDLSVADTGSVTVGDGVTFNFDTGTAGNAVVQVGQSAGGSELAFGAGGLAIGGNTKTSARLTLRGVGSVVASGANGVVTVTDGLYDVQGTATFSELGDASNFGVVIGVTSASSGTHLISGATFDGCGGLNAANTLPAGMGFTMSRVKFVNGAGVKDMELPALAPSGGVNRSVDGCSFSKLVRFTPAGFVFTNCYFGGEVQSTGGAGGWTNYAGNFIQLLSTSGGGIVGSFVFGNTSDCYFLANSGNDNPHIIIPSNTGTGYTISRCIVEYTKGFVSDGGESVYTTNSGDCVVTELVVLPCGGSGGAAGSLPSGTINYGGNGGSTGDNTSLKVRRCALHSTHIGGGIFIGDGANNTGQITEVKDTIFWVHASDTSVGFAISAFGGLATTDVCTPTGVHHNLRININTTTPYEGIYSSTPGANDTVVNGVAVNSILYAPERNIGTFAVAAGSASSTYGDQVDDALAMLFDDPGLIAVLNTHIRGGVAIINPTYKGLASDGLDHGACWMPTPLEPGTANVSTVTFANWSHALNTGVTPAAGDFAFKSGRTCSGVTVTGSSVTLTGISPTYNGAVIGDYVTHTPGTNKITGTDTSQAIKFAMLVSDASAFVGTPGNRRPTRQFRNRALTRM
jgi:hypothetical protein